MKSVEKHMHKKINRSEMKKKSYIGLCGFANIFVRYNC